MVNLIQCGVGNVGSLCKAVETLGYPIKIVKNDKDFDLSSKKIIMPGVGSFDAFVESLKDKNLFGTIKNLVLKDKFYLLGICVGMQVLFSKSEEGHLDGLGLLSGDVIKFKQTNNKILKVPHMGWNLLNFREKNNIFYCENKRFYFAHSFHAKCEKDDIVSESSHTVNFPSIVSNNKNIIGFQFHPEKSYKSGLDLLNKFIKLDDQT